MRGIGPLGLPRNRCSPTGTMAATNAAIMTGAAKCLLVDARSAGKLHSFVVSDPSLEGS